MAVLYITEFGTFGGRLQIASMPPLAEQTVAIGGTTTQSTAFGSQTRFIRVHTDAICSIAIDTNPTATAVKLRLAAGAAEYFSVQPGQKLAVITNT